jgi:hypothetical protein
LFGKLLTLLFKIVDILQNFVNGLYSIHYYAFAKLISPKAIAAVTELIFTEFGQKLGLKIKIK